MAIDDKIPAMTDKELQNLHDNATRISQGAASKQQAEALRLLPIVAEAIANRQTLRTSEAADRKAVRQKDMADARAKKAAARKAAKEAETESEQAE